MILSGDLKVTKTHHYTHRRDFFFLFRRNVRREKLVVLSVENISWPFLVLYIARIFKQKLIHNVAG